MTDDVKFLQIFSSHCGTSTRHKLVCAHEILHNWTLHLDHWPRGNGFFFAGQRSAWFNNGVSLRALQVYLPNTRWGVHLRGNRMQHISFPWTPTTNLGKLRTGKLLREMQSEGLAYTSWHDLDVAKIESHWLSSGTGEFSPTCCSRNRFAAAFGPASFTWLFNANCPSRIVRLDRLDLSKAFTGARVNPAMCFAFW